MLYSNFSNDYEIGRVKVSAMLSSTSKVMRKEHFLRKLKVVNNKNNSLKEAQILLEGYNSGVGNN